MDFSALIRDVGLPIIDEVTESLQGVIALRAWIGTDDYSKPTYANAIFIPAIIEDATHLRRIGRGQTDITDAQETKLRSVITIPRPVAANGAANRKEPIDPRDQITLPNGYTGPIVNVEGVIDPLTGKPYMFVIGLG